MEHKVCVSNSEVILEELEKNAVSEKKDAVDNKDVVKECEEKDPVTVDQERPKVQDFIIEKSEAIKELENKDIIIENQEEVIESEAKRSTIKSEKEAKESEAKDLITENTEEVKKIDTKDKNIENKDQIKESEVKDPITENAEEFKEIYNKVEIIENKEKLNAEEVEEIDTKDKIIENEEEVKEIDTEDKIIENKEQVKESDVEEIDTKDKNIENKDQIKESEVKDPITENAEEFKEIYNKNEIIEIKEQLNAEEVEEIETKDKIIENKEQVKESEVEEIDTKDKIIEKKEQVKESEVEEIDTKDKIIENIEQVKESEAKNLLISKDEKVKESEPKHSIIEIKEEFKELENKDLIIEKIEEAKESETKDIFNSNYETVTPTEATKTQDSDGNVLVSQYRQHKTLGRGSSAKVKLLSSNNTFYAAKVFTKSFLSNKKDYIETENGELMLTDALADFYREIAIMKKLKHPNILSLKEVIYDVSTDKFYLIMDYCEKGAVMEWDTDIEAFYYPWTQSAQISDHILHQICKGAVQGLHYLHYHNIAHRDIKPQNMLLSEDLTVKLADFGQSHITSDSVMSRRTLGTFAFYPPECCGDDLNFNPKPCDVWALGMTFYAIVYQKLPFDAYNELKLFENILNFQLEFPEDKVVDEGLKDLIRKMLEKDPEKRITVDGIKLHPWISQDERVEVICEEVISVSEKEIKDAVRTVGNIFSAKKFGMVWKKKATAKFGES